MLDIMTSSDLREKFIEFFESRGHTVVPSSSLIPDDPSVLLTSAGMQQFKPYFVGKIDPKKDFGSKNVVSVQKIFRTSDIDEVGNEGHLTFFEMMGNFSFGGYMKKEAIQYAYDYLKEIGLEIDYTTIFEGDKDVPKDEESKKIWNSLGIKDVREAGREDNFWGPTGNEGPCGPTTEIYIRSTEIWNLVFNEYYCSKDGTLKPLDTPGVDTGVGLERLAMVSQDVPTVFETDLFSVTLNMLPEDLDMRIKRIITDHTRGIVFLLSDGVRPSNKEAGYILRRLMRRVLVYAYLHEIDILPILQNIVNQYSKHYTELSGTIVGEEFVKEKEKFEKSIARGIKELKKSDTIDARSAFKIYESFGLPYEIIKELGAERADSLVREEFDEEFKKHQEISRAGRATKFGGHGLILDTGELKAKDKEELKKVTRLHTATHLLQAALRHVLGDGVHQSGSDITVERLRFDFTFDRRITDSEIKEMEKWVNDVVKRNVPMICKEMSFEDATHTGALYFAREKYPGTVKVYSAEDPKTGTVFSSELCGGPPVEHTGEVGKVTITKQESVGAGVRRIRAIVE